MMMTTYENQAQLNELSQQVHELSVAVQALIAVIGPQRFKTERERITEQLHDKATEILVRDGVFRRLDEVQTGCYLIVSRTFDGVRESTKQRFPIDTQEEQIRKLFLGKLRNGLVPFELNGRRGVAVIHDILYPVNPSAG